MKSYKKFLITAASAALCIAVTVPAVTFAAENTDTNVTMADSNENYISQWVTDSSGRIFYYDEFGNMLTGEQEVEGEPYLFSKNGVLKTGWRTVGGKRRYYDPETGKPVYGRFTICGEEFYIEPEQGKFADCIYTDYNDFMYLIGEKGAIILDEGFIEKDGAFYYITSGGFIAEGEYKINDIPYLFADDGKQQVGWVNIDGREYYYDSENGEIKLGLINIDNSCYFIDINEGKKEGIVDIDGVDYYFSEETGQLQTGLLEINGNIKYFYEDGTYAVGITEINGKNYLFNEIGSRVSGLNTVEGKLYYADENGEAVTGLIEADGNSYYFGDDYSAESGMFEIDGSKYLFGEDYTMLTGKQPYNGEYYCFDTNGGKMLTGKLLISDKKYYFSPDDGTMQTGWIELDEGKYYFSEDGSAALGITEVDGKKYYLHPDTALLMTGRLIIDGNKYYFGEDGAMAKGWVTLEDGKYFFGEDGIMSTGWTTIGSNKYYFNESNGKMVTNKIQDGYNLTEDGIAVPLSDVQVRAQSIINSIGKDTKSIYNYVCNNNKYRFIEETRTLNQINQQGWAYFANYSLNNRYVVCYYFAAVTDLLFKQAGLECRVVYGTGRGSGDHYWNQVYDAASNTWLNYDTCNGYYGVSFSYLQSQNYTFYQYVYPKYY